MTNDRSENRRIKVTVECIIEVKDEAALEQAAFAEIDRVEFVVAEGLIIDQVCAEQRDELRGVCYVSSSSRARTAP